MFSITVGRFQNEQVTVLGRIRVRQNGSVGASEVSGEENPIRRSLVIKEGKQDKTRAKYVTGSAESYNFV